MEVGARRALHLGEDHERRAVDKTALNAATVPRGAAKVAAEHQYFSGENIRQSFTAGVDRDAGRPASTRRCTTTGRSSRTTDRRRSAARAPPSALRRLPSRTTCGTTRKTMSGSMRGGASTRRAAGLRLGLVQRQSEQEALRLRHDEHPLGRVEELVARDAVGSAQVLVPHDAGDYLESRPGWEANDPAYLLAFTPSSTSPTRSTNQSSSTSTGRRWTTSAFRSRASTRPTTTTKRRSAAPRPPATSY